jgi:hypothetical protein
VEQRDKAAEENQKEVSIYNQPFRKKWFDEYNVVKRLVYGAFGV